MKFLIILAIIVIIPIILYILLCHNIKKESKKREEKHTLSEVDFKRLANSITILNTQEIRLIQFAYEYNQFTDVYHPIDLTGTNFYRINYYLDTCFSEKIRMTANNLYEEAFLLMNHLEPYLEEKGKKITYEIRVEQHKLKSGKTWMGYISPEYARKINASSDIVITMKYLE